MKSAEFIHYFLDFVQPFIIVKAKKPSVPSVSSVERTVTKGYF